MTGPKLTSIPIYKDDLPEFIKLELEHGHRTGKRVSHPEFFNIMLKKIKESG